MSSDPSKEMGKEIDRLDQAFPGLMDEPQTILFVMLGGREIRVTAPARFILKIWWNQDRLYEEFQELRSICLSLGC